MDIVVYSVHLISARHLIGIMPPSVHITKLRVVSGGNNLYKPLSKMYKHNLNINRLEI